jgi:intracellular sulfur oxidation DsrE/DsrF family protein
VSTRAPARAIGTRDETYLRQITYRRLNIGPAKTRKEEFLRFVPSGVATVAESQAKGFAYLKVG